MAKISRRKIASKSAKGKVARLGNAKPATRSVSVKAKQASGSQRPEPAAVEKAPAARSNTKQAQVLLMLRATGGTTIEAIMSATGWKSHSVRGFFAGVVRKKLGLDMTSEPSDGGRIYRIGGRGAAQKDAAASANAAA